MKAILCSILLLFSQATFTLAQSPPVTDIFLAELQWHGDSLAIRQCKKVVAHPGYDNQPLFLPDGRSFLFTSMRNGQQTDVFRYDLNADSVWQVTATQESEYSPTAMPDGRHFSAVRVERDSTQRLWQFRLDGGEPRVLLPDIMPVGYHAWLDSVRVALFVLGEPVTLQIANIRTQETQIFLGQIGRCLRKQPDTTAITFVHKLSDGEWWIKSLRFPKLEFADIVRTLPDSEDFCWTPGGILLMGQGSVLYRFDPRRDKTWQSVADLASFGVHGITRLAISPDGHKLAIVAKE
ncbi:MAG: hypothetical protein Q9P90_08720 [candidate division KSB1 bacterium]|nr:hypothetical protein [candidate division KSB1 bacterium]